MKSEFTCCVVTVLALSFSSIEAGAAKEKPSSEAEETVVSGQFDGAMDSVSYFLDQLGSDEDAQWKYGLIVVQDLTRAGRVKEAEALLPFAGGYRQPVACVAVGRAALAQPEADVETAKRMLAKAESSSKGLAEWKARRAKMRILVLKADLGDTAEAEKLITQETADADVLQAQMDIFGILDARAVAADLEKFIDSKNTGRTTDASALLNAAMVFQKKGDKEKAIQLLKRAGDIAQTRIEPQTISQLSRVSTELQALGQKEAAVAYSVVADSLALKISDMAEYKGAALSECLRLALALGDKDRALALLEAAKVSAQRATYPYSAAAWSAYARACIACGEEKLAYASLAGSLKDAAHFPHPRARAIAAIDVLRCYLTEGKEPAGMVLAALAELRRQTGVLAEKTPASQDAEGKEAQPKAE